MSTIFYPFSDNRLWEQRRNIIIVLDILEILAHDCGINFLKIKLKLEMYKDCAVILLKRLIQRYANSEQIQQRIHLTPTEFLNLEHDKRYDLEWFPI